MEQYYSVNQPSYNPYEVNQRVVKDYFKRPIIMTIIIITAVSFVASVVSSIVSVGPLAGLLSEMLSQAEDAVSSGSSGISLDFSINLGSISGVGIVSFIGFIILYVKSRNSSPLSKPDSGVTLMWVMSIIQIVTASFAILMTILIAVFCAFIISANTLGGTFPDSETFGITVGFVAFVMFIFVLVVALSLLYSINKFRFWGSVRSSLRSFQLQCRGAAYCGVFHIISSVFSLIIAVLMLVLLPYYPALIGNMYYRISSSDITAIMIMSAIQIVISAVSDICLAVMYFGYKKHIAAAAANMPPFTGFPQANQAPNSPIGYTYNPASESRTGSAPFQPPFTAGGPNMNPPENNIPAQQVDVAQNPFAVPQPPKPAQPSQPVPPVQPVQPVPPVPPAEPVQPVQESEKPEIEAAADGESNPPQPTEPENNAVFERQEPTNTAQQPEKRAPEMRFCPNCGKQIGGDYTFCDNCGYRLK